MTRTKYIYKLNSNNEKEEEEEKKIYVIYRCKSRIFRCLDLYDRHHAAAKPSFHIMGMIIIYLYDVDYTRDNPRSNYFHEFVILHYYIIVIILILFTGVHSDRIWDLDVLYNVINTVAIIYEHVRKITFFYLPT